jgi:hypothetical protein
MVDAQPIAHDRLVSLKPEIVYCIGRLVSMIAIGVYPPGRDRAVPWLSEDAKCVGIVHYRRNLRKH